MKRRIKDEEKLEIVKKYTNEGNVVAKQIIRELYDGSNVSLDRKHNLAKRILS